MKDLISDEKIFTQFFENECKKFQSIVALENLWTNFSSFSSVSSTISILDPIQQSLYQDYCLLYLELLSSLLASFQEMKRRTAESNENLLKENLELHSVTSMTCIQRISDWDFIHRKQRERHHNVSITLSSFEKDFIKGALQYFSQLFFQNSFIIQV